VLEQATAVGADEAGTVLISGGREVPKKHVGREGLPRTLGEYELLERIGEGDMGVVYKARQVHLDRIVAIKVLPGAQLARKERGMCS
jgi:serine/threonine protein kinase